MKSHILEINKRVSKGGRKNIRMILLTIHEDGEMNRNGISWVEQYVSDNLDSIKGMPICATFLDDDKDVLLDHGYTETIELEDGKSEPLFLNSESVGVIESAKIEDIKIDGETKRVLVGYGYVFCQRYKNLCNKLENSQVKSSIEIMGTDENNRKIIYDGGYKESGRKPMIFDFTGTCLLGVLEADENCYVLEVAQKINKEEKIKMDEKELKALIQNTISESNSKNDELGTKITELNEQLTKKDGQISELNASVEQLQTALDKLKAEYETYWEERALLEKELVKAKVATKLGELDSTIGEFNEAEQAFAKDDIDALRSNIETCEKSEDLENMTSEINSIKAKICTAIVENQKKLESEKAEQIAEQNASKANETIDIFSEINSAEDKEDEDINIF